MLYAAVHGMAPRGPHQAQELVTAVIDDFADTWAGHVVTMPVERTRRLHLRNAAIHGAFNGINHADLARQFKLSQRHVYAVLSKKPGDGPVRMDAIQQSIDHAAATLKRAGLPATGAAEVANAFGEYLSTQWGGIQLVFSISFRSQIAARDSKARELFDGCNLAAVAAEMGVSEEAAHWMVVRADVRAAAAALRRA